MVIILTLIFCSGYSQNSVKYCDTNKVVDEPVYLLVDTMPEFIGGDENLIKYIDDSLDLSGLPVPKGKYIISYVTVTISPEGNVIYSCVIMRSSSTPISAYDKRAIEFVNTLKFTPGIKNGKAVHMVRNLPIRFEAKRIKKAR